MPRTGRAVAERKPKSALKTIARISQYMLHKSWMVALSVAFVLISAGAGVAGTYFLKPLINEGILPLVGQNVQLKDFEPFLRTIIGMSAIYLVGALSSYAYSFLMIKVSNGTLNAIRKDMFNSMQDAPIKYFDTHTHGELMSRYTNDVDAVREAISIGLSMLMASCITIVGTFTMMLILSPILTLMIVIMLFVMFTITRIVSSRSSMSFKKQQKVIGTVNGYIEEIIEGQKVVKVFSHEEEVKKTFANLNENLRVVATDANTYANIMMPIMGNLSYLNYAFTAAVGAVMVITDRMDIGTIAAFLQYTRSFSHPIAQISQQFNAILAALAGAERIFEVIDESPEQDQGFVSLVNVAKEERCIISESKVCTGVWAWKCQQTDGSVTYTDLTGKIRFANLNFGYEENKIVLHDISLFAKPGQKVALVGSTGAGKTTITNLLNRFYEVPKGKIFYDGIDINDIKKDDLRRSLGMVLQDTHMFTDTVRENIRYGKLEATDDEVIEAAKLANAHCFIMNLPQGYDTKLVLDGANLSAGQRQLIAVARAAIANPPVLILDEATSSIDTRTEALVEKGMDKLMHGRTVFVIAHRLSTVRNADAIIVMENGAVIECGSHDDLIGKHGKYYQLYTGNFDLDVLSTSS
ncbi:MAG: ABC transporter ATP-binding protein [Acidaminococcaceae bacterium]